MIQALAMAINIARIIADLSKQAQGANGSRLSEIMNGVGSLTGQAVGMIELAQRLYEADRVELTPEEEQSIKDADDAARDVQRRVLGAMNDESGDEKQQAKQREEQREKARKEAPEFSHARKAAEDRGKSR